MAVRLLTHSVVGTSFQFYDDEELKRLSVKAITNPQVRLPPVDGETAAAGLKAQSSLGYTAASVASEKLVVCVLLVVGEQTATLRLSARGQHTMIAVPRVWNRYKPQPSQTSHVASCYPWSSSFPLLRRRGVLIFALLLRL